MPDRTEGEGWKPNRLSTLKRARGLNLVSSTGAKMTKVGMLIDGEAMTWDDWLSCKKQLDEWFGVSRKMEQAIQFSLGDLLLFGEDKFKDQFYQHVDEVGYDFRTLQNWMFIAKHVPYETRRPELTWTHHRMVASLPAEEQRRFLDTALREAMSANRMLGFIDDEKAREILMEVPAEERGFWDEWRRALNKSWRELDNAVGRGLIEEARKELSKGVVPTFPLWWRKYNATGRSPGQIARDAWVACERHCQSLKPRRGMVGSK